mgnify:CR=1 FL=1
MRIGPGQFRDEMSLKKNKLPATEFTIRDPEGGTNQTGLRDQNARLVLSFIRRHGELASAEIARRSGLSAQTVSNIVRSLELDGLVVRRKSVKGGVGKPSTPVALNPVGVYSLGLNIGRRSMEAVLVDFSGASVEHFREAYSFPTPKNVREFLGRAMENVQQVHPKAWKKVKDIGVSAPFWLWDWSDVTNAPSERMLQWRDVSIASIVAEQSGRRVVFENDATSACVAEHMIGRGGQFSDFLYVYVGSFVGGGVVLNGKVFTGRKGNSGALGPLPVPDGKGGMTQLMNVASLNVLETELIAAGLPADIIRSNPDDWSSLEPQLTEWIDKTANALAVAIIAAASVIDIEAVIMDGAFPEEIRRLLVERTSDRLEDSDLSGLEQPLVLEASVGRSARSKGAALLPIRESYFLA